MSCDTATNVNALDRSEITEYSTDFGYSSLSDFSRGIDLDDYLEELEKRMAAETDHDGDSSSGSLRNTPDLMTQLQQKERDLMLAAELGKALLERNEELTKRQELLAKDYSARIEVRSKILYPELTESIPDFQNLFQILSLNIHSIVVRFNTTHS